MFVVYEYATCIVVALIAAALPFTLFAILLLLKNGAEYLSRTLQKLCLPVSSPIADFLSGRCPSRSLARERIGPIYSEEANEGGDEFTN